MANGDGMDRRELRERAQSAASSLAGTISGAARQAVRRFRSDETPELDDALL